MNSVCINGSHTCCFCVSAAGDLLTPLLTPNEKARGDDSLRLSLERDCEEGPTIRAPGTVAPSDGSRRLTLWASVD